MSGSVSLLSGQNIGLERGHRALVAGQHIDIRAGQLTLLRGPNGSGKTTFLRALAGLVSPNMGSFTAAFGIKIGYIGHQDGLKPTESLIEHLSFWAKMSGQTDANEVPAAAQQMGLSQQISLPCGVLSAGQKRRASFARLLLQSANIWLVDEPLAPLDDDGRALVADLMAQHLAAGGAICAAVHGDFPLKPDHTIQFADIKMVEPVMADGESW